MKASDFIANFLSKHSKFAFGGQGSSVIHIVDSIHKNKKIKFIPGQSEQGSSIAADAYYRVSKKIGITIGTSGPGILNFLQGMACSYFDSIPSLYIAGAPVVTQLRKNKKIRQIGFQEMEVQDMVKPICKYSVIIKNINQLSYELEKCIFIANTGRKGPVLIEIPDDISRQNMPKKIKRFSQKKTKKYSKTFDAEKIYRFFEKSQRPLIVIGNGCILSNSINDIKKFINKNKIPYLPTWATMHLFNSHDKLNFGTFGVAASRYGNFAIQKSDFVIFLGVRLSSQLVGGNHKNFAPNAKKILVDIDKEEFTNHLLKSDLIKYNCNVKDFIRNLNYLKIKNSNIKKKWVISINNLKKNYPILIKKNTLNNRFVDPYYFFNKFYTSIKANSIVIPDASANLIWAYQSLLTDKKPEMFTAFNHSPMGYSIAASVGASFASRNKKIYALIGDGSVPMNVQELETIKNYNVNVAIIVLDNKGYGLIKQTQETWLNSKYAGTDEASGLSLPDNQKIALSYGIKSYSLINNKNVKKNLQKLLSLKGPLLINVNIDPKSRVKPKIEYGKPLHDMYPYIKKSKLKEIMNN